jgi:XTP/dITP diphosphohydrolase
LKVDDCGVSPFARDQLSSNALKVNITMKQIVLASGNLGKLREMAPLLAPLDITVLPQSAFQIGDAEESAPTFVENALLKARHASSLAVLPAIADDSGLIVDALDGAPGVYSARYAGAQARDEQNIDKLLRALKGVSEDLRTARFYCVVVYLAGPTDPMPRIFEGTWEGRILHQPTGQGGFGYDPVFYVPAKGCSAAQLALETKNALSHRGQALRKLVQGLRTIGD